MKRRIFGNRIMPFVSVIAAVALLFVMCFSVFAATDIGYTSLGGATLSYVPVEETLPEQTQKLEDCGFIVSNDEATGEISLKLNDSSPDGLGGIFDQTSPSALREKHAQLIESGILSYIVYNNSVCNIMTDLVVCLDFTDYNVTTFDAGFLNGLTYAITGSLNFLNIRGATFTETTQGGTVTLIDAAEGREITECNATLFLQGISTNQSRTSTLTVYDLSDNVIETRYIQSYSLRIVLPRNSWGEEIHTITFNDGSLVSTGVAELSASPPTSIGLDISNITLRGDEKVVYVAENATSDNTNHFHYIGTTLEQLQYALRESLDYVLDPAHTASDYVEEIFVKPYTNTYFCRVYAGVGKEGGAAYVSVYDQPTEANLTRHDLGGTLLLFWWLRFAYAFPEGVAPEDLAYRHYERDENNEVVTTAGALTCDWTIDASAPDKLHAVHCSHQPNTNTEAPTLVGYFDANGTFYDAFGAAIA